MNRLFTFACFCTCSIASWATPINYVFNFTVTGGLNDVKILPSGQFTYDPAIPAFSNFFVSWNSASLNFDLTSAANKPLQSRLHVGPHRSRCRFQFLIHGRGWGLWRYRVARRDFPRPDGVEAIVIPNFWIYRRLIHLIE